MRFSIVIPIYNSSEYLSCCLNSILEQSVADWECILVNDGSTDDSSQICDTYAGRDSRFRVFHMPNRGVSSARNVGIRMAAGEYLTFVDSDDTVDSNYLRCLVNNVFDDVELVVSGYRRYNANQELSYSTSESITGVINSSDFLTQLYQPSICEYAGYICGKLYKLSVLKQNNIYFDEDVFYNEDRLFLCRYLCSISGNVSWNMKQTYNYYIRQTSASNSLSSRSLGRYLTDLTASMRMRELVLVKNSKLAFYADYSLIQSYHRICEIIGKDGKLVLKGRIKLIIMNTIGWINYYRIMNKSTN